MYDFLIQKPQLSGTPLVFAKKNAWISTKTHPQTSSIATYLGPRDLQRCQATHSRLVQRGARGPTFAKGTKASDDF